MLQLPLVGLVRVSALFVRKGVSELELRHIYVKGRFLIALIVTGSVLPAKTVANADVRHEVRCNLL